MLLINQQVLQIRELVWHLIFDFRRKSLKHLPVLFWDSKSVTFNKLCLYSLFCDESTAYFMFLFSLFFAYKSLSFQVVSAI